MSSNDPPIGPGIESVFAGYAFGRLAVKAEQDNAEANELARELTAVRERLLKEMATRTAAFSLANTMVDELTAEAEGKPVKRRLSDPSQKEARKQHVNEVAEAELNRLSNGRLSFGRPGRNRL